MKTIYFVLVFFILSTFLAATIINVPGDQPTIYRYQIMESSAK